MVAFRWGVPGNEDPANLDWTGMNAAGHRKCDPIQPVIHEVAKGGLSGARHAGKTSGAVAGKL